MPTHSLAIHFLQDRAVSLSQHGYMSSLYLWSMSDIGWCLQSTRTLTVGGRAAISWCVTSSGCGHRSITWNRSATRAGLQQLSRLSTAPHHRRVCTVCCSTDLCSITGLKPTVLTATISSASRMMPNEQTRRMAVADWGVARPNDWAFKDMKRLGHAEVQKISPIDRIWKF